MTKLEQKLIELGYKKNPYITDYYTKNSKAFSKVVIFISTFHNEIDDKGFSPVGYIREEREIDLLYEVMKEIQKDLEELKKYE